MRGSQFEKRYGGTSLSRLPYILKGLVVTEKSTSEKQNGRYTFRVDSSANKLDIKKAVTHFFKVDVVAVNTLHRLGKVRRFKGVLGKTSASKRAIVRLKAGQVIDTGGEQ